MEGHIYPGIEVRKASVTTIQVDGLVNPTTSFCYMVGGVSKVIKTIGGREIEDEAIEHAPVPVGDAIITNAGSLVAKKIIHTPLRHEPTDIIDESVVSCALDAALSVADANKMRSLAIPMLVGSDASISKRDAAQVMINCLAGRKFNTVEHIIFLDIDEEVVEYFDEALLGKHAKKKEPEKTAPTAKIAAQRNGSEISAKKKKIPTAKKAPAKKKMPAPAKKSNPAQKKAAKSKPAAKKRR